MTDETRRQLELPIDEWEVDERDTTPNPILDLARRQLPLFDSYEQADLPFDSTT